MFKVVSGNGGLNQLVSFNDGRWGVGTTGERPATGEQVFSGMFFSTYNNARRYFEARQKGIQEYFDKFGTAAE